MTLKQLTHSAAIAVPLLFLGACTAAETGASACTSRLEPPPSRELSWGLPPNTGLRDRCCQRGARGVTRTHANM